MYDITPIKTSHSMAAQEEMLPVSRRNPPSGYYDSYHQDIMGWFGTESKVYPLTIKTWWKTWVMFPRKLSFIGDLPAMFDDTEGLTRFGELYKLGTANQRNRSDPHPDTLFWNSFWHTIWKNILNNIGYTSYSDILFDILSGIHWHSFWHFLKQYADILSGIYSDISGILFGIYSDILFDMGTAGPTEIWRSRLRPGSAHWDVELTVGARQCPTRSWDARLLGEKEKEAILIKSRDPHLAGGEKDNVYFYFSKILLFYLFGGRTAIIAPWVLHWNKASGPPRI